MGRWQKHTRNRASQNPYRLKIHVSNTQKAIRLSKLFVRKAVEETLDFLGIQAEELAVYFVTQKKICALHQAFFEDPSPTDCISFPLDDQHLGEVFVCPKVAIEYARERKKDPYDEILLYVIHGLLHLLGYDDLTSGEKREMRKMEKRCMGHLKAKGIALGPSPR